MDLKLNVTNQSVLILLPGMSPRHELWSQQIQHITQPIVPTIIQSYEHWKNQTSMNYEAEYNTFIQQTKKCKNYIVFGKSIGSVLILDALQKAEISPCAIILLGIPLNTVKEKSEVFSYIARIAQPLLVFQNNQDPHASASQIAPLLPKQARLISLFANNHDYPHSVIKSDLVNFLLTLGL